MRQTLIWSLAATLALTAWALLKPASSDTPGPVAGVIPPAPRTVGVAPPLRQATLAALPEHWPTPAIEPATRNPFIEPQPPAPKPLPAAPPPPPPQPPQPVANYRFWGRMASPEGRQLVFLARGDAGAPVPVEVGAKLEDGWSVEAIGDNRIVLVHSATNVRENVTIPPAAQAGAR